MTELLVVVSVALVASGLCSVLEAVLLSVPASHVALLRRQNRAGGWLWDMRRNLDEPIAAILTLNTIAHTVGAAMAGALALELWGNEWMALFSAALTLAILLLSEILPKTIGARYARALALPAARVLVGLRLVLRPVLIPLAWFNRLVAGAGRSGPTISRAELEVLAEIGRQEGTLDEDEWRIVTRAIRLHEVRADQVMVPRNEVVALSQAATVEEARRTLLLHGHTRLPVYHRDLDGLVGVVAATDLAEAPGGAPVDRFLRPVLFLPGAVPADTALAQLRESGDKLAAVVDEFGGTAGILTVTDLLDELVGPRTSGSRCAGHPGVERLSDRTVAVDGRMPLRELEHELAIRLDGGDHDTVGGFVLHRLGRVPVPGDAVAADSWQVVVTDMDRRRVRRVELRGGGEWKETS